MTEARCTLKAAPTVHSELVQLSEDYRLAIGDLTDILLEYAMSDLSRVDLAIDERKARGLENARARRGTTEASPASIAQRRLSPPKPSVARE